MSAVTAERFRALARSSPWRWRTLRFVVQWNGDNPIRPEPVRGWLRRPDGLRVETLAGQLLQAGRAAPGPAGAMLTCSGRGEPISALSPLDPEAPLPEFDADGLVLRRPSQYDPLEYDDPMFQSYHWVAMLDPVELADSEEPGGHHPAVVRDAHEVDHHGRPGWEAVLEPTDHYDPRCTCCPLLHSLQSDRLDWESIGQTQAGHGAGFEYADAHRVRLDVGTGVCVLTEELGGSHHGSGHEVLVEAVDEPMADELFVGRRRRGPR